MVKQRAAQGAPVVSVRVAEGAFRAAYRHGEHAGRRPLTEYAEARISEARGEGMARSWDAEELARWFRVRAGEVRPKGTGPFLAPGSTRTGYRRDADCSAVGWAAFDHDGGRPWDALLSILWENGAAFVAHRSPSHRDADGGHRWRLWLPLRAEYIPGEDQRAFVARWKRELYPAARIALGTVGGLGAEGFDPSTDALLNRFYPPSPRTAGVRLDVLHAEGTGLDVEALAAVLLKAGTIAPATGQSTTRATEWDPERGAHPILAALRAMGLLGRQLDAEGKHAVACPWSAEHTGGRPGDTSTVVFPSGVFHCSHAHCRHRTARDVVGVMPEDVRRRYLDTLGQTRAVRRVLDALPAPVPTVPAREAAERVRHTVRTIAPGVPSLVRASPGSGKSHAADVEAAERAARGEHTVLLVQNHAAAREHIERLAKLGTAVRYARSIEAVKGPEGVPVCRRLPLVHAVQSAGLSARELVCRGGASGEECPHRNACPAASAWEGPSDALVTVATHAMAPLALRDLPDDAVCIVDELPGSPVERRALTQEGIDAARDVAWHVDDAARGAALGLLVESLACGVATNDGADRMAALDRLHAEDHPALAMALDLHGSPEALARALVGDRGPLAPDGFALARLRAGQNAEGWRVLDAARRWFESSARFEREGEAAVASYPTGSWEAIRSRRLVAVLDGTADPERVRALFGRDVAVTAVDVAETADVRRVVLARSEASRKNWCPSGRVVRWTEDLRGALRSVVGAIVANVPPGRSVLFCSFRPVTQALQAAWEAGDGPGWDLLAPLKRAGYGVRWTYYGATDTRGANAHDDCAASVTFGDPYPNLGDARRTARALGLDENVEPERIARETLGQLHDRLRAVRRTGLLVSIHVGQIVPEGAGWHRDAVEIAAPKMGRPVTARVDVRADVGELIRRTGSQRKAAEAIGCHHKMVAKILGGASVSADLAERVRRALRGGDQCPVLKNVEGAGEILAPDFSRHPNAANSGQIPQWLAATLGSERITVEYAPAWRGE